MLWNFITDYKKQRFGSVQMYVTDIYCLYCSVSCNQPRLELGLGIVVPFEGAFLRTTLEKEYFGTYSDFRMQRIVFRSFCPDSRMNRIQLTQNKRNCVLSEGFSD